MAKRTKPVPRASYDYEGPARGYWAALVSGPHRVLLTESPRSLLSLYAAGLLTGEALADAERLAQTDEGRVYLAWRERILSPSPAGKA